MIKISPDETPQRPFTDFLGLHSAFTDSLEEAFEKNDIQILRNVFESFRANSDQDKKSPLDQAFRELLLYKLSEDVVKIGELVRLSVEAVRAGIVSVTIPVVLLADIFDAVTLDRCDKIFSFVEDMVEVWKEEIFFSSCKNNILRMCNDLLRRLSRAQNTVFCGRILLFLSKFFPFSERSGLNIVSEFNLDNITEYGVDANLNDLDEALEDTVEDVPIQIDYSLYCKFWSLQDFFRNPNQCYSKPQWKMFQSHAATILEAFASFKLEEENLSSSSKHTEESSFETSHLKMEDDSDIVVKSKVKGEVDAEHIRMSDNFFAKFLTNPKLLALQLSDSNFRRSVLVQFLILFQYLQLTVKFKTEANTLTSAQIDFIKENEDMVFRLLEETPPNGKRFARTVKHMLSREEMWNNWKNEGCKEFKKPAELEDMDTEICKAPPVKRFKRTLGESLRDANRSGKFFLGNDVLTRLWNYSPDNLQACKGEERNFLPQVDTYLENPREKSDPSFEWRALRLLARQSPHFFTFVNTPSYKIADYLESVRKKITKEKFEINKTINTPGNGGSGATDVIEQEAVEQEAEQADLEDEEDLEKIGTVAGVEDDKNAHSKPVTATREDIEEIAPLVGDEWKKLGKKLGYTADEMLYFETENEQEKKRYGGCVDVLMNWFHDDDDASLDNLAYILEGLEINAAAKAVKLIIERSSTKEDKIEVLSD